MLGWWSECLGLSAATVIALLTDLLQGLLSALKAWVLPLAMLSLAVNLIFIFVIVILSILLTRPRAACPDHWVGYWEKCYYFSEPRDEWTDSQDQCSAFGASLAGIDTWQEMPACPFASFNAHPTREMPCRCGACSLWKPCSKAPTHGPCIEPCINSNCTTACKQTGHMLSRPALAAPCQDFLVHYKGSFGHWIGLRRELGQAWKWANGTKFNHWFPIAGEEQCAFLSHNNVASSGCPNCQPWICSKPAQKPEGGAKRL